MSRVANDTAWKRRVLKEEAVLERKNIALARGKLSSSSNPSPTPKAEENVGSAVKSRVPSLDGRQSAGRHTPSNRNTPSPSLNLGSHVESQGLRHDLPLENIRAASSRKFDPTPRSRTSSRSSQNDDARSVSSYSSGTSIQSYPSTRSVDYGSLHAVLRFRGLLI